MTCLWPACNAAICGGVDFCKTTFRTLCVRYARSRKCVPNCTVLVSVDVEAFHKLFVAGRTDFPVTPPQRHFLHNPKTNSAGL